MAGVVYIHGSEPPAVVAEVTAAVRSVFKDVSVAAWDTLTWVTTATGTTVSSMGGELPTAGLWWVRAFGSRSGVDYTRRMAAAAGAIVVNTAEVTRVCVDKAVSAAVLAAAGVPTIATMSGANVPAVADYARLSKPRTGFGGEGLRVHRAGDIVGWEDTTGRVVQPYLPAGVRSWRYLIAGGDVVTAYTVTTMGGPASNVSAGGVPAAAGISTVCAEVALAAAEAVGATIAGVDLIDYHGDPVVVEVNSQPGLSTAEHLHPGTHVGVVRALAGLVSSAGSSGVV